MEGLLVLPILGMVLALLGLPLLVLGLLAATLILRGRVRRLEERLTQLEAAAGAAARAPAPTPPAGAPPVGAPTGADWSEAAVSPPDVPAVTAAPSAPAPFAPVPPAPVPLAPVLPGPAPASPAPAEPVGAETGGGVGALEGRLGGTWLSRVGAAVLVLGIALFLRYAFERDWVGPAGRVGLGVLIGLGFVLSAARHLEGPYRVPAQGAAAVGLATLYLSAYAAYGVYGLVQAGPAFAALLLVTVATMRLALRHQALALALLAGAGALLTPVLLDTGTDRGELLFAYLAVVDGGLLAVAHRRDWGSLRLLAFGGTAVLYGAWLEAWFRPGRLAVGLEAATGFYLLFALAAYRGAPPPATEDRRARPFNAVALVFLAAPTLYFLAARRLLAAEPRSTLALICLCLALGYALAGQWAVRRPRANPHLGALCLALALAFLTLAFAVRFTRHTLVIAWSVEALALLWAGHRLQRRGLRAGAALIFLLAWLRWYTLLSDGGPAGAFLVANPALPATVAAMVSAGLAALVYRGRERAGAPGTGWEAVAQPILVLFTVGSAATLLSVELARFRTLVIPPPYVPTVIGVVWMIAALPWLALARSDRTRILIGAVTALLLVLGATTVGDAPRWARLLPELRPPVLNVRFLAALLLVVLCWLYARVAPVLSGLRERTRTRLGALGSLAAGLLLLWNLSAEVWLAPIEGLGADEAAKARSAGLSVLWALYAFVTMGLGLRYRRRALRLGAVALFAVTVAKVLTVDLAGLDPIYRIVSLVVVGGLLLLASFLYVRARRRRADEPSGTAVASPPTGVD